MDPDPGNPRQEDKKRFHLPPLATMCIQMQPKMEFFIIYIFMYLPHWPGEHGALGQRDASFSYNAFPRHMVP